MGQQVQPRAIGHGVDQRQRVGKGADTQRGVVQRVDPLGVICKQAFDTARVLVPQLAKGADGVDKGAVDQDQDGAAVGRSGNGFAQPVALAFQCGEAAAARQAVDAGCDLPVHLGHHARGGQVGHGAVVLAKAQHIDASQDEFADQPPGALR